jgi:BolA protein
MSVRDQIEVNVMGALEPVHMELYDESHMHNVPDGAESHWRILVVASSFEAQRQIARHRAIYRALKEELRGRIHALAITAMTPSEWQKSGGALPESPPCLGGSKADS